MNTVVVCNCYKRPAFTKLCVPMAIRHAGMDAHWLLADDASGDGTAEFLHTLEAPNIAVRAHRENRGHYVLRNEGFDYALTFEADVVVNIDNDILFPWNWLRDLVTAFDGSGFGVGSAWVVNDRTLTGMVEKALSAPISDTTLHDQWADTQGCGGACIAHSRAVLDSGCRYDEKRTLFTFGDSAFNGIAMQKGFRVGVYLGVQCWHLQTIIWPDEQYEEWKLALRHKHRHGDMDGFDASLNRDKARTIPGRVAE